MDCRYAQSLFDDLLDGSLTLPAREALQRHLVECTACRAAHEQARAVQRALRALPVEPPEPGFAARALRAARTAQPDGMRRPRYGFAAGFASALAASLAVWLVAAPPQPPAAAGPSITVARDQTQTINLVVNVPQDMPDAILAVHLPEATELAGYPGERQLLWQTSLRRGENLLALPVIVRGATAGELVATVTHGDQQKIFRLQLQVQPAGATGRRWF